MAQIQGILGAIFIIFLAFLLSNNKNKINYRLVLWGIGLQLFFAILIILTPIGKPFFSWFDKAITKLLAFSEEGSRFLFESFVPGVGLDLGLINFAFIALPTVIFFSALMAMFYHYGIVQKIIAFISKVMQKTMGSSGAETTSVSANIFVGQTEAPLIVKPFISKMTKSELMAIMVGGFATVAGGVMAVYVSILGHIDGIAGHLLAASIMSAPAALAIAKIIYPETEKTMSSGEIKMSIEKQDDNGLEALARGSSDGLKLAANIAAMLVAFVAFIALVNYLLGFIPIGDGKTLSLDIVLGYLFMPLAWMMGAPWSESESLGALMGQKLVLTELVAYGNLSNMEISPRTAIIASYALCGFANFASIGIQIGGIGSIAPERRKDLSKLVFKAMLGGALASWLTASIAGVMIPLQKVGDMNYDKVFDLEDKKIIESRLLYQELSYADLNKDGAINNIVEAAFIFEKNNALESLYQFKNDWEWSKEKGDWEYIGNNDNPYMLQYEIILKFVTENWDVVKTELESAKYKKLVEKITRKPMPKKIVDWEFYYADTNQDGVVDYRDLRIFYGELDAGKEEKEWIFEFDIKVKLDTKIEKGGK